MKPWPVVPADVVGYLGVGPSSVEDTGFMATVAEAATRWVERTILGDPEAAPTEVDADVKLGSIMLAGRLYNRRTSVMGIAAFSDMGVSMVVRDDPDIRRMLGLGAPRVG